ncbi:hypothetical protein [Streptomyces sp. NPDC020747]|uniref:hypothetical protein n=1 Tax=Streptomyces sp. NPDC020747 TaxID=3365086 RepID=UPI0037B3AECC
MLRDVLGGVGVAADGSLSEQIATLGEQQAVEGVRLAAHPAVEALWTVPRRSSGIGIVYFQAAADGPRADVVPEDREAFSGGRFTVHDIDCGHCQMMAPTRSLASAALCPSTSQDIERGPGVQLLSETDFADLALDAEEDLSQVWRRLRTGGTCPSAAAAWHQAWLLASGF